MTATTIATAIATAALTAAAARVINSKHRRAAEARAEALAAKMERLEQALQDTRREAERQYHALCDIRRARDQFRNRYSNAQDKLDRKERTIQNMVKTIKAIKDLNALNAIKAIDELTAKREQEQAAPETTPEPATAADEETTTTNHTQNTPQDMSASDTPLIPISAETIRAHYEKDNLIRDLSAENEALRAYIKAIDELTAKREQEQAAPETTHAPATAADEETTTTNHTQNTPQA